MTVTIPSGTRVDGLLETDADLDVIGQIDGRIEISGTLRILEGGSCRASVRAHTAEVFGEVLGSIICTHAIAVFAGGRVVGDLRAPDIEVDAKAFVDGGVDLLPPSPRFAPVRRSPATAAGPGIRRPSPPLPVTEIEKIDR